MYGAFVETMDHYLGQFFRALDDLGLTETTFVVFLSDNGGHPGDTSNLPLRGCKWTLYEGGVRVPFIIRWPGIVEPGSTCEVPVTGTDLFPTFCELAGAEPDPALTLDGTSLVPLAEGQARGSGSGLALLALSLLPSSLEATKARQPCSSIRKGNLKLIHFYEDSRNELYDLSDDLGEQRDLSRKWPERAQELERDLFAYLESVEARLPRPAPSYAG